jgi:SOS response regulatory protein OraA/RecX
MIGQVTALRPRPRDAARVELFINQSKAATLSRLQVEQLGIAVGSTIDAELAERIAQAAAVDGALRQANRWLERRSYSSGKLRDRLERSDVERPIAQQVVDHLLSIRAIDDVAYGRALIARVQGRRPAGTRLLRHKLLAERVPEAAIEQLLNEQRNARDPVADAEQIARRYLAGGTAQRTDDRTRRRRLWALLMRRGFDAQTAGMVMDRIGGAEDELSA